MTRRLHPDAPHRAPRRPTTTWRAIRLAAALGIALAVSAAPALESDRRKPASIEADRVEIDRPAGVSRYYGNVVFVQGTLRITGDRMMLRAPGGVVEHAEVHGERATIRQQTEAGDIVHARARHIIYEPDEGLVTLIETAELERGGDRFNAARIEYRPDTGRIDASGSGDGEDGRVRIRIEPQQGAANAPNDDASGDVDDDDTGGSP